ncbi:hypothetical protein CFC21_064552 [Triticum aestivum]|uniref:Uncharacterized protein n=2 Tax=Triticum aestivum TaxID=4565 RepID=A0A3B6KEE1_WHEAT|nr:hypothetical protein CFC21_064552 [Triticum aestivum]
MDAAEARWAWHRYGPSRQGPRSTGRPTVLAVVQAIKAEGGSSLFIPEKERRRLRERKPEDGEKGSASYVVRRRGKQWVGGEASGSRRWRAERRLMEVVPAMPCGWRGHGSRGLAAANEREVEEAGMVSRSVEAGERAGDAVLGCHGLLLLLHEEHTERERV